MRVLHLLDPAVLRRTEYRSRTLALIGALRAQGVQTVQLAGPESGPRLDAGAAAEAPDDAAAGWHVYRTVAPVRPGWLKRGAAPALPGSLPAALAGPLPPTLIGACSAAWSTALSAAACALRLRQVARLTRPDLIHVHAPGGHAPVWHALALLAAGNRRRLPLVAEAERRGAGPYPLPPLARWALARAGALAAPSLEMRAALRGAGIGCRRIAVIPPATALAGIARRDPGPPGLDGAPLIAFSGTLEPGGGIDLLLAVLDVLRRRHPALRLVVAGGGLREDVLAGRVGASAARGRVVITGRLSARRVADLLPRADIAVFPGLAGGGAELAPSRHLLNAMAQGCAIVASDIACHRELLVHGHSAMLFPAGSRKALAEVLSGLLDRPERRRALGMAAAACAAARHSWPATAACYRQLYASVLSNHQR